MELNRIDYRRVGVAESIAMHRFLDAVLTGSGIMRELARLADLADGRAATAFESYAASVLRAAGAGKVVQPGSPLAGKLKVLAPEGGLLARIACSAPLAKGDRQLVEATETALNRLISVVDAIDDGIYAGRSDAFRERVTISYQGCEVSQAHAAYRSASVELPPLGADGRVTTGYYNEVDWRSLDHIASIARTLFQRSLVPNMRQSVLGAHAPAGSDWDMRTRLAAILKGLELPFRCRFRFDCDAARGIVSVRFDMPPSCVLPAALPASSTATDLPRTEQVASSPSGGVESDAQATTQATAGECPSDALEVLALRLACLVAAACFGGGRNVQRVHLLAMEDGWRNAALACSFKRDAYVRSVLVAVDSGELSDPRLRFRPEEVAAAMGADYLDWTSSSAHSPRYRRKVAIPIESDLRLTGTHPPADTPLSEDMASLFRAKRLCDIDTGGYFGGSGDLVEEARRDSDDSIMAAVVRLESIVAKLEAETSPPNDDAGARPLYCPHALARLAVCLLDDELSVGEQAEAFLRGDLRDSDSFLEYAKAPLYFRAPNALYHAHMGLSDLYQRIGDHAGAMMHADRCVALAPTAADSYYRKADILAEQGLHSQAANVLMAGLRCCIAQTDSSLLYYYLGLLFWNMDLKREAAAVLVYAASLLGEFAEKSAKVVGALRKRESAPVIVHASPVAASNEMRRLRIPVVPVDMRAQVACATLGLSSMNAPDAAAPFAAALARYCQNDDVIVAACQSMLHEAPGVPR